MDRPLFNPQQPYGIEQYPFYRVKEVAQILGLGPDKVRGLFRDGGYGEVVTIESQRTRRHRKNYVTILVPYQTLIELLKNDRSARRAS